MQHTAARAARRAGPMVLAVLLASCSGFNTSQYDELFHYTHMVFSGEGKMVTRKQAASTPYASIGVSVGDGPQDMLLLATDMTSGKIWTSASRMVITTDRGRVVRTDGLAKNLGGLTTQSAADEVDSFRHPGRTSRYLADFPDLMAYSVPISCRASRGEPDPIRILGASIRTIHVDEDCSAPDLKWNFENQYWLDPSTQQVWRSVQHIHPGLAPIQIDILRPTSP